MSGYELLIRAGRLFCAATGLDGPGAVAVSAGRIAGAGPDVGGSAAVTRELPDCLLLPGLVDFHTHPDTAPSRYGIAPDEQMLPYGSTTVMSQGDAGAANWEAYRENVIRRSRTRIRMALNLSARGEAGPGPCFERLEDADVEACAAAAAAAEVWGIAVNTSLPSCGPTDPREVMARGLEAAERSGKPLLFGSRLEPDWPLAEQLPLLRAGDVVTYCFSPNPEGLLADGKVRDEVWEARARGVLFDVGHGMASFSFRTARAAIEQGFLPDTVSTDLYRRHLGAEPRHDLPRTISKLIACGMPEKEAFARATSRPAALLGLAGETGTLRVGACADLAVLRWNPRGAPLRDVQGETLAAGCWELVLTLRGGEPVVPPR